MHHAGAVGLRGLLAAQQGADVEAVR
jgi:hypothetical protein